MGVGLAVVVAGIPGSGKTTLATSLSSELGWPLLSKDVVKEALFDTLGTGDLQWSRTLGRASHVVIGSLSTTMPRVILEAHFQPGIAEPELLALGRPLVQLYCRCPVEVAADRYRRRVGDPTRHPGHLPEHQSQQAIDQWFTTAPVPLDLPGAALIEVDTTGPFAIEDIASSIRSVDGRTSMTIRPPDPARTQKPPEAPRRAEPLP